MKKLTDKEFDNAPSKVQWLYMMFRSGQPIGISMFDECVKEYPEYFPDEVEYSRKWNSIPQSVHDEHNSERAIIHEKCYKGLPQSKGMYWLVNHPDEYEEWLVGYNKARKKEVAMLRVLHRKTYGKYGIKFVGI